MSEESPLFSGGEGFEDTEGPLYEAFVDAYSLVGAYEGSLK